ncbi:hypothetical protein [Methanobrevibacter sp.]|uniref:hypothetical protein n=1 Tax=Methanobrevibacter sp. TaxID=66852 RepID=UPI00388CFCBB
MRIIKNFKKQSLFIKILDVLSLICVIYEIIIFAITGTLNYSIMPGIIVIISISTIFRKKD